MICKKVGVVGAGTMGAGIAHLLASVAEQVVLLDIKEEFVGGGMKKIAGRLCNGSHATRGHGRIGYRFPYQNATDIVA